MPLSGKTFRTRLMLCGFRRCVTDERPTTRGTGIEVVVENRTVTVRDNGIGMSRANLQDYFWTIGSSGKRDREAREAGCVGMFGIGGFANFGVCDVLQVTSQDGSSPTGTHTRLSALDIRKAGTAIPSVTVSDSHAAAPRGTIVVGELSAVADGEELKTYLRSFVRFRPDHHNLQWRADIATTVFGGGRSGEPDSYWWRRKGMAQRGYGPSWVAYGRIVDIQSWQQSRNCIVAIIGLR